MIARLRRLVATAFALAVLAALSGCAAHHPVLLEGDASGARITYSGDLAGAAAIARRHCESYGRVARFHVADMDTAYYDCVEPKR